MNSWSLAGLDGAVGGFSKEEVIVRSKEYAVYWDCFCCLVCVCVCVCINFKKKIKSTQIQVRNLTTPAACSAKLDPS